MSLSILNSCNRCCLAILLFLLSGVGACNRPLPVDVEISIDDSVADHIHPVGAQFSVVASLKSNADSVLRFHWRDISGHPLSEQRDIRANSATVIDSPAGAPAYLELVFSPVDTASKIAGREPGEEQVFGFAHLSRVDRAARDEPASSSPFGMVHADIADPFIAAWVKTTTWLTVGPDHWAERIATRRSAGALELPIIVDGAWATDDNMVVQDAQLDMLSARASRYFSADTQVEYWELGIEENLSSSFDAPLYWTNLALKARAVREAADSVNPQIQLIYQIAELRLADIDAFLSSDAAQYFDILSLHPYAWPDFPPPETWLPEFLESVRASMQRHRRQMPIWFTEVGAPVRGNHPDRFFGYPKKRVSVPGFSRSAAAMYLIKMYVVAIQNSVEKVFWYNFRDRGSSRERAEDHFGLVDYLGFPKPGYVAYVELQRALSTLHPAELPNRKDGVYLFGFTNGPRYVVVCWSAPGEQLNLDLRDVLQQPIGGRRVSVKDAIGMPLPVHDNNILISAEPVYVIVE